MTNILWIVVIVDLLYVVKMIRSATKVGFVPKLILDDLFWARVGFLMAFHVIMLIVTLVVTYIGAIVAAAG